jgi:hypothetical protein
MQERPAAGDTAADPHDTARPGPHPQPGPAPVGPAVHPPPQEPVEAPEDPGPAPVGPAVHPPGPASPEPPRNRGPVPGAGRDEGTPRRGL